MRNLAAALAHYSALGFDTFAYADGDEYGFADREGTGLHLAADSDHDPAHHASAYLYVRDADALYQEWAGRALAATPGRSARRPISSARARTPIRTGT